MIEEAKKIKNKIQSRGYWRVIIRPTFDFYQKDRFELQNLPKAIEVSHVNLRGWPYPYFNIEEIEISGQDKIRSYCDFEGEIEYWEFTTSGQFGHIFAMWEDYVIDEEEANKIRSRFRFGNEKLNQINKFFEIVAATYKFTEIFKFAANLVQLKEYKDVEKIEMLIELYDVKERMLFIENPFRFLLEPYICKIEDNKIIFHELYEKDDLIAKFNIYAVEWVINVFRLFNWQNPNRQILEEDQKKLLERRL
ncbi:hypothetical protein HRbin34_00614 [bacterium HR34]|nr:hypothetical protein HRbin34_00614 [bacterium HR34]